MEDKEFQAALLKARVGFMRKPESVFLTTVCFMLKMRFNEPGYETAATDGEWLIINTDFFMKLPAEQRITLLAHETMHVVLQHVCRGASFPDHTRFNHAADYVINLMLKASGFEPIPGWLCDEKYRDMTTEEVYHLLPDMTAQPMSGSGGFDDIRQPGTFDPSQSGFGQGQTMTAEELAAKERAITGILSQAAAAAQMAGQPGSVPGAVQIFLDSLLKPKLPLAYHLRKFFKALAKTDYSWAKINRRFGRKIMLPGLKGEAMSELDFAVDVSGSTSDHDVLRAISELAGVMKQCKPSALNLIQFDHGIRSIDRITSIGDLSRVKMTGRGGTSIHPVMELTKKRKPTALVVFTDGEYSHPKIDPGVPVLWLVFGRTKDNFRCKFGTIIRFNT